MFASDESHRRGFAAVPDQVPLVEWDPVLGIPRIVPVDLDHAAKAQARGDRPAGGYAIDTSPILTWMPGRWARRWARLRGLLGLTRSAWGPAS